MPTSYGSGGRTPALLWALVSSCSVTTRLHFDIFRTVNMRPVLLRVGREPSTPQTWYTKPETCFSKLAQVHRVLIHHVRAHSGIPGNEVADVLANTGRIRGPAPVQRVAPQCFHDSARGSRQPGRNIQLDALLFWEAKLPDPMVRPSPPDDAASQPATSLVIATANVLTLYPQEEALRTVFRPTRDRVVMIDAHGRLGGGSHPFAGEHLQDFDDNGYFLRDFMHDWDMEAPASFELALSTWTSRAGKEQEIEFVLIPSAWHDLVQWNAVIPRVALALQSQEDHRLVAIQVAFQPKPSVAVASPTFSSRDVLQNPETAQQIQQSHDSVPVIPPERDATTAVELFSKLTRIVLAYFAPGPRRPWITMGRSTAASRGETHALRHHTTMPPQPSLPGLF